jgi:hypothetical protein
MTNRHLNICNEFDLEAARKAGQSDERELIIKIIEQVITIRRLEDKVGRNKDWWGDPNLEPKLELAHQILDLLKRLEPLRPKSSLLNIQINQLIEQQPKNNRWWNKQ